MIKKFNVLLVGGTFDNDGGRPSGLIEKIANALATKENYNFTYFNGGKYDDLVTIQDKLESTDIVLWWPNVPNDLPKLRDVKAINYKVISIISKRNDNNKYTFQQLLQRTLEQKGNLNVVFEKQEDNTFKFSLIDPLGNCFYEGKNVEELVDALEKRATFLKSITRAGTTNDTEHVGMFDWYYKMFNENIVNDCQWSVERMNQTEDIKSKTKFIELVKEYGEIFTKTIFNVKEQSEIKRFLGNASFRCQKGFPSFREGNFIFVSRRNVDKTHISINEFIPTYLKDDRVYYLGENKPSVDSPVQLKLYEKFPKIKYMLHAHVYIDGALTTSEALPCGALEEVNEIVNTITANGTKAEDVSYAAINLLGHGCLIMSDDVEKIEALKDKIINRPKPERLFEIQK